MKLFPGKLQLLTNGIINRQQSSVFLMLKTYGNMSNKYNVFVSYDVIVGIDFNFWETFIYHSFGHSIAYEVGGQILSFSISKSELSFWRRDYSFVQHLFLVFFSCVRMILSNGNFINDVKFVSRSRSRLTSINEDMNNECHYAMASLCLSLSKFRSWIYRQRYFYFKQ